MRRRDEFHRIPTPAADDIERINEMLRKVGGSNVVWGAQTALDVWVVEQRARLDERLSKRVHSASVALVWATLGLVFCTAGLIWATVAA